MSDKFQKILIILFVAGSLVASSIFYRLWFFSSLPKEWAQMIFALAIFSLLLPWVGVVIWRNVFKKLLFQNQRSR